MKEFMTVTWLAANKKEDKAIGFACNDYKRLSCR